MAQPIATTVLGSDPLPEDGGHSHTAEARLIREERSRLFPGEPFRHEMSSVIRKALQSRSSMRPENGIQWHLLTYVARCQSRRSSLQSAARHADGAGKGWRFGPAPPRQRKDCAVHELGPLADAAPPPKGGIVQYWRVGMLQTNKTLGTVGPSRRRRRCETRRFDWVLAGIAALVKPSGRTGRTDRSRNTIGCATKRRPCRCLTAKRPDSYLALSDVARVETPAVHLLRALSPNAGPTNNWTAGARSTASSTGA